MPICHKFTMPNESRTTVAVLSVRSGENARVTSRVLTGDGSVGGIDSVPLCVLGDPDLDVVRSRRNENPFTWGRSE
jgi:hypothetical protein